MKEKLTLRNVAIWFAALLALVVFIVSFTVKFWYGTKAGGIMFNNFIWGSKSGAEWADGRMFGGSFPGVGPAVLPLIGILLVLLSAIGAVVVSFVVKDEKLRKIIILVCAGLMLLGGVFAFITRPTGAKLLWSAVHFKEEEAIQLGYNPRCPGGVACGILAILGAVSIAVPQFLKDIKFVR